MWLPQTSTCYAVTIQKLQALCIYISLSCHLTFVQQKYILAKWSFIFQRVTRVVISGLSVRVQGELEDLHEITSGIYFLKSKVGRLWCTDLKPPISVQSLISNFNWCQKCVHDGFLTHRGVGHPAALTAAAVVTYYFIKSLEKLSPTPMPLIIQHIYFLIFQNKTPWAFAVSWHLNVIT